jgi:hypothetical protein
MQQDMATCNANAAALRKTQDVLTDNPQTILGSQANQLKVLQGMAKSNAHLNEMNQRLIMILTAYVSGSNFTSDNAHMMIGLGKGEDALREMFRQKMKKG